MSEINQFSQPQEATGATPAPLDTSDERRASCGARVCSVDYTHGPHRHGDGVVYLDAPAGPPLHEQADRDGDDVPSDDGALMIRVPYADLEALVERAEADAAEVARVEALHAGQPAWVDNICRECRKPWPCPTIAALRSPAPTEEADHD